MITIEQKKEIIETKYIAGDGEVFENKYGCSIYEEELYYKIIRNFLNIKGKWGYCRNREDYLAFQTLHMRMNQINCISESLNDLPDWYKIDFDNEGYHRMISLKSLKREMSQNIKDIFESDNNKS